MINLQILRRASLTLAASVLFFLGAIGYLYTQAQQTAVEEAAEAGEIIEGVETATPTPEVETQPPTPSATRRCAASSESWSRM